MIEEELFLGFTSRQQETYYTKATDKCLQLLAERLLQLYKPDENFNLDREIRWAKQIRKIIKAIVFMEKGKMTYPKFGESPAL